jgi:anti-sigma regulatory factor (Ser/Thr protein kinase)
MFEARAFDAHPSSLAAVRAFIAGRAAERGIPTEEAGELGLAVHEAVANAIVHSDSAEVRVSWERIDSCVEVQVEDQGMYRAAVPVTEPGGRGIPLMTALVNQLSLKPGTVASPGTVVRLMKCWDSTVATG